MSKKKSDKQKSVKSHIIKNMVFLNVPKEEIDKILKGKK